MSTKLTVAGTIVIGLVLIGCGDDDDGDMVDAGRDAGMLDATIAADAQAADAAMDAAAMDDAAADAAVAEFTSTLALTTAQEVPVCAAAGASAMGSGTVSIDAAGTTVTVADLTYSGLSGPATGGHIHFGAPGVAGPIVLPFSDLTSPINETFTASDYPSPAPAGAPADFAALVAAIRSGQTYVNIHTADCAPGEIRDQIE